MFRLLAVCGLLTISRSFNFAANDESSYQTALREQGFSEKEVNLFLQEFREAHEGVDDAEVGKPVTWPEARGYEECDDLHRRTCGSFGMKRCTGCLTPKPLTDICQEYECPPMEEIGNADGCGFEARRLLSANWAVTSIDTSNKESGETEAYWRLFKYANKANSQGARIAKSAFVIKRRRFDDKTADLAFYIPSAYQADPPASTDGRVTVESWSAVTYDRAFGGDRTGSPAHFKKQFKMLKKVLAKDDGLTPFPRLRITFQHTRPGCGNQRNEVMLVDESSM